MKNKKSLNDKIVQSVFTYETKKFTFESLMKVLVFTLSVGIILVFGGVIYDLFAESGIGELSLGEFMVIAEKEVPFWLIAVYIFGLLLGCIIIGIAIKNRKRIFHKIVSLITYWTHL